MKTRLKGVLAVAGIAAVLLTGCVSSKKYKASQAALAQMRNDSARLAQQVSSLNENVQTLQQKNTDLQRSLDSTSTSYTTAQKNLDYYSTYFKTQQGTMSQVSDDLKNALSQAGLTNADIQQENNIIYVRLNENDIFKKNSTAVTTSGKQALDGVANVVKSHSDVNVFVADDDSASAGGAGSMSSSDNSSMGANSSDMSSDNATANAAPRRHRTHHAAARKSATASGSGGAQSSSGASSGSTASSSTESTNKGTVAHKRVHHRASSEGGMTYYSNGTKASKSKAWALKQARMGMVANSMLSNGVPKVNVSLHQPATSNPTNNNIKVVIVPAMNDFNPQTGAAAGGASK